MITDHPQVEVEVKGFQFQCDVLLKDTLVALGEAGLISLFSCQGDYTRRKRSHVVNRAYILFEQNESLKSFVTFLQENHEGFAQSKFYTSTDVRSDYFIIPKGARKHQYNLEADVYGSQGRLCIRYPFRELELFESLALNFAKTIDS